MHLDMSTLQPMQAYAMMTQTIIPRPVAWVLTANDDGSLNLAPFSYFNGISSEPPMIMFSIGVRPDGSLKDTRLNIEARREFVVHIAHREMAAAMTASSATMGRGESEVSKLGLETTDMPGTQLPRLRDCRIAYACEMVSVHFIGEQQLVFGELKHLYVADEAVSRDQKGRVKIDAGVIDPIGRLGGGEYVMAGDIVSIDRPA